MTELRTEEEQIAALKQWWNDNGKSLLIGISLALVIVFGWKAYQNSVIQTKSEASALYQQLIAEATKNKLDNEEESKDYELASSELNWVLSHSDDQRIQHIIKGRLARILSEQGNHQGALDMLNASLSQFEPSYFELIGDIKSRMGEQEAAIDAYKSAYALIKEKPQAQPLLAVKLSDLGVNPETL